MRSTLPGRVTSQALQCARSSWAPSSPPVGLGTLQQCCLARKAGLGLTCISGGSSGGDVPAGWDPAGPRLCDGCVNPEQRQPNIPIIQPLQKSAPLALCGSVWARVTLLPKVSLGPQRFTGHIWVSQCHPSSGAWFAVPVLMSWSRTSTSFSHKSLSTTGSLRDWLCRSLAAQGEGRERSPFCLCPSTGENRQLPLPAAARVSITPGWRGTATALG